MRTTYDFDQSLTFEDSVADWLVDELDEAIDEVLDEFGESGNLLTATQVNKAVQRNQYYAKSLGWQNELNRIAPLLVASFCVPSKPSYTMEDFAQAVACWQKKQGFIGKEVDGIIGPTTWQRMQSALGLQSRSRREAPSQIDVSRPAWIEWQPSPYHSPRGNLPITTVILHFTAGPSLENTVRWFQNNPSNVSAHYVIGKDGRIVQMVSLERVAHHAAGANRSSIGIEIVNWGWLLPRGQRIPGTQNRCAYQFCSWRGQPYTGAQPIQAWNRYWEPFRDAQYNALSRLLRYVTAQIPTITQVIGHKDVSKAGKLDPGGAFDWDRLRSALRPNFTGYIGFLSRS